MLPGTHLALACPVVLVTHMQLPLALGFLLGSLLPDKLDFFFSGGNFATWTCIHRTWTHTWWVLLLGFIALFFISSSSLPGNLAILAGKGVFLGMLYHTFWDAFTPMGIPLVHPMGRRYGLGIIASRGFRATVLCIFCTCITVWLLYVQIFSDDQIVTIVQEYGKKLHLVFPEIVRLWGKIVTP